jgi:hypothetical protein
LIGTATDLSALNFGLPAGSHSLQALGGTQRSFTCMGDFCFCDASVPTDCMKMGLECSSGILTCGYFKCPGCPPEQQQHYSCYCYK